VSLQRVRRAAALRPAAIQVILADWFPLTNVEAIDCLNHFGEAADGIGLVLYNPPHAKRTLEPADYGRLGQSVPALVGLKVADRDEAWYADKRRFTQGLSLFVPGHHLATGMRLGAHGSYSNVACLSPAGAQRWYGQMQSEPAAALEMEGRIRRCFDRHIHPLIAERGYCNAAVDKLLAAIGAWAPVGTRLRWPYRWIDSEVAARLRPAVREELPELFD
jgi:dihydrodipicolinate synthase/N-acetylneuraminate lyase